MTGLKQFLLGLMLLGAVTYFGGGGTWASFSAETSNSGESIASGTLTMTDTASATACLSANGAAQNNVNPACNAALSLLNVAPGVYGGVGQITIQNTGSIDASKLFVWASPTNSTLTGTLSTVTNTTSLPIATLEGQITSGDQIVLSFGTHTQTFVASGATAGNATSISVTSQLANFAYPTGTTVTDISTTTVNNANCFDVKTTSPGTVGATKGTDLNYNPTTGNPFCAATLIFVQETTGGFNYCWLGKGSSPEAATGLCTAPISVNIRTALVTGSPITSLPVTALNGNVSAGDSIVVTSGSNTQTFTVAAGQSATFGALSIPITSATPGFAYPITSTVVDTTSQGTLNSDTTDTITNFNTAHSLSGKIQLYPVTASGTVDTAAPTQLTHASTRTFQVGLYVPAPAGTNQNQLQGLSSEFGITWHMDQ